MVILPQIILPRAATNPAARPAWRPPQAAPAAVSKGRDRAEEEWSNTRWNNTRWNNTGEEWSNTRWNNHGEEQGTPGGLLSLVPIGAPGTYLRLLLGGAAAMQSGDVGLLLRLCLHLAPAVWALSRAPLKTMPPVMARLISSSPALRPVGLSGFTINDFCWDVEIYAQGRRLPVRSLPARPPCHFNPINGGTGAHR